MLDHVSLGSKNIDAAVEFYDAVLTTLGYRRLNFFDIPHYGKIAGYGADHPVFWIGSNTSGPADEPVGRAFGMHVAFSAPNRAAVRAFFEEAMKRGAKDNGTPPGPGLRPHYHENYYGCFLIDPEGWRIEACCHGPE